MNIPTIIASFPLPPAIWCVVTMMHKYINRPLRKSIRFPLYTQRLCSMSVDSGAFTFAYHSKCSSFIDKLIKDRQNEEDDILFGFGWRYALQMVNVVIKNYNFESKIFTRQHDTTLRRIILQLLHTTITAIRI